MSIRDLIEKYPEEAWKITVSINTVEKVRHDAWIKIYEGLLANVPDNMLDREIAGFCDCSKGIPDYIDVFIDLSFCGEER